MIGNNIAFDIDGVIVDLVTQLKYFLSFDGYRIKKNGQFKIQTEPHLSNTQIWKRIERCYHHWDTTPIFNGAPELIKALYSKTLHPVKFVTSRPIRTAHHTHQLMRRVCGDVPFEISFAQHNKYKFLNGIQYFVEDRRRNAIDLAVCGKTVYLIDTDYNQMPDYSGITRIYNITSLINSVHRFIVLTRKIG